MPTDRDELWRALIDNRARAERVARSRCGSRDEADECVQEAMTRVAAMPDVDLQRVGPLLSTVVSNLAVDGHRARTRADRHRHRVVALVQPSHDADVCDTHEAHWLWAQRRGLPSQDRRVIELRAAGYSLAQAAVELGITYKAAENALGRARRRLRAVWRATASVVGLLWGARHLRPRLASPAMAFGSLAAVALVMGLSPHEPAAPGHRAPATGQPAQASTGTGPALAELNAQPGTMATPKRIPRTSAVPRAAENRAQYLAGTPAISVGPVRVGASHAERRRGNESFLETTQDCLRRGVVVKVDYVGCPQ